ncbi:MAG TPA: Holliday junction branch migration protein RuvA [Candidatus Binatia bacterium]|nr:Holliday junction branch migration protein RuvA [Candidatus Binatia bacterium]
MIATLFGVVEKLKTELVINVNGVGYGLLVTNEDYGRLESGREAKVYIYEHIREQSHELFGFLKLDTKELFEQLLSVNGIGPKMALSLLNIGSPDTIRRAIAAGDVKFICQAPGVGKRVAERVIIELKNKVGLLAVDLQDIGLLQAEDQLMKDEAIAALISLGYSLPDAGAALKSIDPSLPTEERVKLALKGGS